MMYPSAKIPSPVKKRATRPKPPACFRLVRAENNPFPDASQRLPLDEAKDVVQTLPIQQAFYRPTWNRRVNDEDAKGIQGIRYPGEHV